MRKTIFYLAALLLISSTVILILLGGAAQDGTVLIAKADQLFDRWTGDFNFATYERKLQEAIGLWEEAIPLLPADWIQTRAHVLNRLAQAYFELAEGYLVADREKDEAYGKGKDFALESLRLDPDFVRAEEAEGLHAALNSVKDIAAVFWYGNTLERWLNYHQMTGLTVGVKDVLVSFERSVHLDETYNGGGPHRALAAFLTQVPVSRGSDLEGPRPHFERAIEIDGDYLENYVNYAKLYAKPKQDWGLYCSLLRKALDKVYDPAVMRRWPFYNQLAVDQAQQEWRDPGQRLCTTLYELS